MLLAQLSLLTVYLINYAASSALNPEETLYVYTTCFDEFAPKDGPTRKQRAETWFRNWDITAPNAPGTQCFVKCVLEGVGLVDSGKGTFAVRKLSKQMKPYQKYTKLTDSDVGSVASTLKDLKLKANDCGTIHSMFASVFAKVKDTFRKLYHGHLDIADKIYTAEGTKIKQKSATYASYCENNLPKNTTIFRTCSIRKYNINVKPDDALKNYIDCIFKGYRYISDGSFHANNLLKDFHKIGKTDSDYDKRVEAVLKQCTKDVTAYGYYECLLKSALKEDFTAALRYREYRSKDYKSVIGGDNYNAAQVNQYTAELLKDCPTQAQIDEMFREKKDDYLTLGGGQLLKS